MTICVNCTDQAAYYVADPGANALYYCRVCLPRNLRLRAAAGQFPLPKLDAVRASRKRTAKAQ